MPLFDLSQLDLLEQGYQASLAQRPSPAPQVKPKKNFLLDQVSTAGGILGGIGGSFVAPVVGTAGGAAVGSGIGEAIENLIMGDSLGKNVGKEALIGGVFGAGPVKLAKAGYGAVKGAKAGSQAAQATAKTSTKGKLTNLGNKLLTSQYGTIGKPVARATKPEQTFGQLADYGVTKPDDVDRIAAKFTGAGGIVTKAVSKAAGNAGRVPTTGIQQIFDDAIDINGLVEKDAKAVKSVFRAQMSKLMGGPKGSLNPNAHPNDVLEVMRNLEKRAANLTGKGGNYRLSSPERVDQAKALLAVRDELENRLFQASEKTGGLSKVLTPQFRDELVNLQPGNVAWQNFVDSSVMKARNIGELRSTMSPFVKARQIIDEGDINTMTAGGRTGNFLAGSGFGGLIDPIAGMVVGAAQAAARNPLVRATGTGLRKAGGQPTAAPATASRPSPLGITARLGATGAIGGGVNQVSQAASAGATSLEDALLQQSQSADTPSGLFSPSSSNTGPSSPQSNSPFAPENIESAIQQIVANGGGIDDVNKFVSLAGALQKIQSANNPKTSKLTSTQQEKAVRAQNALNDIEVLRKAIESGDINRTLVPGSGTAIGGRLLGTGDVEAALYNIGDVVLRSRTGATAPPEEVKKFVSGFLPRGGESPEQQRNKLERAYRELVGMLNPPGALESEQALTLEDALMAYQ